MPLNILDIVVIVVLIGFVFLGYSRGLVITFFNFFSFLISIILSSLFYPIVTNILRSNQVIFGFLKDSAAKALSLDELVQSGGKAAELQFINSIDIPEFLKQPLLENNNPEVYKMLDVSSLSDYLSGFVANLFISVIAMVIVFVIVFAGLKALSASLNIIAKLPIINTFNKTGGAIIGFFQGVVFLLLAVAVSALFTAGADYAWLHKLIETSLLAHYFYNSNFILASLLSLF